MINSHGRLKGVVLLDALFGETDKFTAWIARHHRVAFFVSAFSQSSAAGNSNVEQWLASHNVPVLHAPPARLTAGVVSFIAAPAEATDDEFVTSAWVA